MIDVDQDPTATISSSDPADLQAWNVVLSKLLEWREDPDVLSDEDIVPPSRGILETAYHLALRMRDCRAPGPLRVVPDGEGGVVFERREGDVFETMNVEANGRIEMLTYYASQLTSRNLLAGGSNGGRRAGIRQNQDSTLLSQSTVITSDT